MAELHLNFKALLNAPGVAHATKIKADQIANDIRSQNIRVGAMEGSGEMDLPVEVSLGTTDRPRANVALAHPAGRAVQAKYGALTKAAARAGLDVHAEPK